MILKYLFAGRSQKTVKPSSVFETDSTFLARPKLYLEDLFINPKFRGLGIGERLFRASAREAIERGCTRMEWTVLDWNEHAIGFYERLGAEHEKAWHIYGLSEQPLAQVVTTAETKK